eukprot:scaffold219030_cov22-Tisochrysis_lutea.AAC.2
MLAKQGYKGYMDTPPLEWFKVAFSPCDRTDTVMRKPGGGTLNTEAVRDHSKTCLRVCVTLRTCPCSYWQQQPVPAKPPPQGSKACSNPSCNGVGWCNYDTGEEADAEGPEHVQGLKCLYLLPFHLVA